MSASMREVRRNVCPLDCPDTCAILTTVQHGRAVEIRGDPDSPFTMGFLCGKVDKYLERVYHPNRLLYPMRRVGPKGAAAFARITWDEALDEIAARLRQADRRANRHRPHAGPDRALPPLALRRELPGGREGGRRLPLVPPRRGRALRVPRRNDLDAAA